VGFVAGVMICSVGADEVAGAEGEGGTVPTPGQLFISFLSGRTYLDQYQSLRWRRPHLQVHQTKLPRIR
jgi:hypothetical protein